MKTGFSIWAFWLAAALTVGASFVSARWNLPSSKGILASDPFGYYAYLPAAFIYHDLEKLSWIDSIDRKYTPAGTSGTYGNPPKRPENRVIKYSSGLALMESPFFLAAHGLARPLGFDRDGFSKPYQIAVAVGGLTAVIIGLFFLRRVLRRFFDERTAGLALLLIAFGTNFHHYAATDYAHTHVWLFAVLTILLWISMLFYEKATLARAVGIGFLVGLATLTRPTEAITALVPLLFGLDFWSKKARAERLQFLKTNARLLAAAIATAAAVGSIQLFYWKAATGDWFFYSYQSETFSFASPHFRDGIFSERKGWLVWTPLMAFAVVGIGFFWRKRRGLFWLLAAHTALNLWITFAWDCWWYGGSFGQRAMVQSYALLALPLAAAVEFASKKAARAFLFAQIGAFLVFLNLFQIYQGQLTGLGLDCEATTPAFFRRMFLNFHPRRDDLKLLDCRYDFVGLDRRDVRLLGELDFSKRIDSVGLDRRANGSEKMALRSDGSVEFVSVGTFFPSKTAGWLRFSGLFSIAGREWDVWRMPYFVISARAADGHSLREASWRPSRLLDENAWRELTFDLKIDGLEAEKIEIFLWQPTKNARPIWLREARVEEFSGD